ncbi:MAG TPA: AI-2E family transporter [bacterium]|nr:AI-2E family transporter [bacterium]
MLNINKQVVISTKTILITLGILLGVYVVYKLRSIFGLIFVSLLITISMESAIKSIMCLTFMNRPLSRGFAVFLSYLMLLLVIVLFFLVAAPMVINESQKLVSNFSFFLVNLELNGESLFESLSFLDVLGNALKPGNVGSILAGSISVLSRLVTLVVLAIYMSSDWPTIKDSFIGVLPKSKEKDLKELLYSVEIHVGTWVKGQLTIMFAVGFLGFLGLSIAGVNYALALGFISAILEIVPILGPLFSTIIATGVGFSQSPTKGLIAFLIFLFIQQVESNLVTPKVMQKFSGFSPLIILIALMIGHEFFGLPGAILAIPVTMILGIFYRRYVHFDKSLD